jgi:hypothetical protein
MGGITARRERRGAGGTIPDSITLEDVLLLGSDGNPTSEAIPIDALTFTPNGVGVIRSRGERARVLPWSSVTTHVVEPWNGGVIPEWWVDPELNRREAPSDPSWAITDPSATNRPRPSLEPGALIGIQTPSQTYRFLLPGGDAREVARQITDLAVRFQGTSGATSVTRAVEWGKDIERRSSPRPQKKPTWSRIQPILVVVLVVFLATAVTLILLQSAGTIHLPYLGGIGSGVVGTARAGSA